MKVLRFFGIIMIWGPFFGLLGTVVGMLEAFAAISQEGMRDPEVLAHHISFALQTTAYGLVVFPIGIAVTIFTTRKINDRLEGDLTGKSFIKTLILAIFLGSFGVHRFYLGRITSGLFMLLLLGGLNVWYLTDITLLSLGRFKDKDRRIVYF